MNFSSRRPRPTRFSSLERDIIALVAGWIGHDLELDLATTSLRDSEQSFRSLFEYSPVATMTDDWSALRSWLDAGAPEDELDIAAAGIENISANPMVAKLLSDIDVGRLRRRAVRYWREDLLAGRPFDRSFATEFETPSGPRHLLFRGHIPRRDGALDLHRVLITRTDYSAIATEATAQLAAERERRLEGLRILAGGVAHDFNNRLLAIVGHAELARLELPERHPALDDLGVVLDEAHRASALSTRMLSYAGHGLLESTETHLCACLGAAVARAQVFATSGTSIEIDLGAAPGPVRFDGELVAQAIDALLRNALEARDEAAPLRVEVRLGPGETAGMAARVLELAICLLQRRGHTVLGSASTLARLRARGEQVPVVLTSGHTEKEVASRINAREGIRHDGYLQ